MSTPSTPLSLDGLEIVYDALAQAIDTASETNSSELFLTKLCLLCAHHLGDEQQFQALVETALKDL